MQLQTHAQTIGKMNYFAYFQYHKKHQRSSNNKSLTQSLDVWSTDVLAASPVSRLYSIKLTSLHWLSGTFCFCQHSCDGRQANAEGPLLALCATAVALATRTLPHALKTYFTDISKVISHKLITENGSLPSWSIAFSLTQLLASSRPQ